MNSQPSTDTNSIFGSIDPAPLISWASRLQKIAAERNDLGAVKEIQQEIDELKSGHFMLVVMGKVKRGKSTFCNAFLGRQNDQVAPVDKMPASCVISKFRRNENEDVKVIFRDGRVESSSYGHIVDFVTEERNPENKREVESLEICGNFQGLEEQIILVDTPGAGSIHKLHDTILMGFIPQADAVIFLVTANMPIAEDELELLKKLKQEDIRKVFFAINKVDACEEDEIQDGIEHNIKMLSEAGITVNKIHRISGKIAMMGNPGNSGVPEFLEDISSFMAENKGRIIRERFLSRLSKISAEMAKTLAFEIASTSKSDEEIHSELSALSDKKGNISTHQEGLEREFRHKWTGAVDDFEKSLPEVERRVKVKVEEFIKDYPILKANGLKKELPSFLSKKVEETLASHVAKFESAARQSVEKLEANYPTLNLGDAGGLTLRMGQENSTLLKGVAGGAVAAATGYGVMAAASGVAASIAAANAAALAAAASSATVGTLIGGGATIGGWIVGGPLGGALGSVGSGMIGTALGSHAAIATAPLWVALAGPVGWAMIGVGALAIPLALRSSQLKMKGELEKASGEQIEDIFNLIRDQRIKNLRDLCGHILEEFAIRLSNELSQIEYALKNALERKKSLKGMEELQDQADQLNTLIQESQRLG
jgi:GTPase Era involved in 16S rRNA processing